MYNTERQVSAKVCVSMYAYVESDGDGCDA